jgi:hypothetical protein
MVTYIANQNNKASAKSQAKEKLSCLSCDDPKVSFYTSINEKHKSTNGKLPWCKSCVEKQYSEYLTKYGDGKLAMYYTCRKFDIYFSSTAYDGAKKNSITTGWTVIASYFKQINSFRNEEGISKNGYGTCFDESSDFLDIQILEEDLKKEPVKNEKDNKPKSKKITFTEQDIQNQNDVYKLIKYDPFIEESEDIKGFLYSKLIDFLDNDTLNDNFKLPIVIEIVKGFGQAERINRALSLIDIVNDTSRIDDVKKLSDTKQNILKSILAMAKDNGISENYSNNKSKGAGTLSGMIKELQEKGICNAEVNIYDIETCDGMKQVADISNKSILEQLILNENDYVEMIKDQRNLIQEFQDKAIKFEEESRLLKIKLKDLESYLKDNKVSKGGV